MSWITLFLGSVLILAGVASLGASIDLSTTELGLAYSICGAIGISGGVVTVAIGLLIRRVDALPATLRRARAPAASAAERVEASTPPLLAGLEPVILAEPGGDSTLGAHDWAEPGSESDSAPTVLVDSIEESREIAAAEESREAPASDAPEVAEASPAEAPPAAPALVGRYSAGGSDYSIFTDGSIEAQTSQGSFRFGSMREFKAFIAAKKT